MASPNGDVVLRYMLDFKDHNIGKGDCKTFPFLKIDYMLNNYSDVFSEDL